MRLTQLGASCGATVSGQSWNTGPGESGDDACPRVYFPNHVIVALSHVKVASSIELDFVRHVQGRLSGRPAITGVRCLPVTRNSVRSTRLQVESTDPLIVPVTKVQRAIGWDDQTVRIIDLLIRVAWDSRADERGNRWPHRDDGRRCQDNEQCPERFAPIH